MEWLIIISIVREGKMEWMTFFKYIGLTTLGIFLVLGLLYWIRVILRKYLPTFKYWFRYKVRKKKINEGVEEMLREDIAKGVEENEIIKSLLISGHATCNQAKEMGYIYNMLKGRCENE